MLKKRYFWLRITVFIFLSTLASVFSFDLISQSKKRALADAVRQNNAALVTKILEQGVSPDIVMSDYPSNDDKQLIKYFSTVFASFKRSNQSEVKQLTYTESITFYHEQKGFTALMYACRKGYLETAIALIKHRANVNKEVSSTVPLHVVLRSVENQGNDRLRLVSELINAGANVNYVGTYSYNLGQTIQNEDAIQYTSALKMALVYKYYDVARLLLSKKANPNIKVGEYSVASEFADSKSPQARQLLENWQKQHNKR